MKTKKTETIFSQLIDAELAEKEAVKKRIAIEQEIFEYVKSQNLIQKSEGQETIEELGYSITVSQPMIYKLDEDKYRELANILPESLQFHRTKIELDKNKFNLLSELPEAKKYFKKIQDCVSSKQGKISVKVKKI